MHLQVKRHLRLLVSRDWSVAMLLIGATIIAGGLVLDRGLVVLVGAGLLAAVNIGVEATSDADGPIRKIQR